VTCASTASSPSLMSFVPRFCDLLHLYSLLLLLLRLLFLLSSFVTHLPKDLPASVRDVFVVVYLSDFRVSARVHAARQD
jgi:hypothetical protein